MNRLVVYTLVCVGCGNGEPCDPFPDETCLSLEVRGPGLSVDQIAVDPLSGFTLLDGRSPATPGARFELPVRVAVLPGGQFAGAVEMEVRGFLENQELGADQLHATLAAGQHLEVIAELGGSHGSDLALSGSADLAGADLAVPPGSDLALPPGSDLAGAPSSDLAGSDLAVTGGFVDESGGLPDVPLNGVFGLSASDVYVTSFDGDIFHSTGDGQWQQQRVGTGRSSPFELLYGVWGPQPDDLYAFGGLLGPKTTLLLHSTGNGQWSALPTLASDGFFAVVIAAFGGTSPTNLYAAVNDSLGSAGANGVYHSVNGTTWTQESAGSITRPYGLFATTASSIYLVDDRIWHSVGNGSWILEQLPATLVSPKASAVWASSPSDVFAVGSAGPPDSGQPLGLHSPGTGTWTDDALPPVADPVFTITGSAANDVWALSKKQLIHFNGSQWTVVPTGAANDLNAVWAGGGELFVVGEHGTILHKR